MRKWNSKLDSQLNSSDSCPHHARQAKIISNSISLVRGAEAWYLHTCTLFFCISSSSLKALRKRKEMETTLPVSQKRGLKVRAYIAWLSWEFTQRSKVRKEDKLHKEERRANVRWCLIELVIASVADCLFSRKVIQTTVSWSCLYEGNERTVYSPAPFHALFLFIQACSMGINFPHYLVASVDYSRWTLRRSEPL